jgi:mRNA interferase RelE/StbE
VNTSYLPSFIRDLKALKKTPIYNSIKAIAFEEVPKYDSSAQINNLKKLKGNDSAYRIRVGDYRMGVFIDNETITFACVQHRRDIDRYFP